tara:strand:- start:780 stop:1430 length:651 start_codon:yes stop_codon:yes gene_type:complete
MQKVWDDEAYVQHPGSNWVYNKLFLSEKLGYYCGPAGVKVKKTGDYIIRPMMNLSGMGVNARIEKVRGGTVPTHEPGFFWSEVFTGRHISANFIFRKGEMYCVHVCEGFNSKERLYRFNRWEKLETLPEECYIPSWLESLCSPNHCNIEFVDGKVIEVHLRHGTDFPENATTIIPIWKDSDQQEHHTWMSAGYTYIDNIDDADGLLDIGRVGFYYK